MKIIAKYGLLLLCAAGYFAASFQVQAQGMSPVVQEFNKKARGAVHVTNTGDVPKIVSCWARGFDVNEHGALQLHPLDAAMDVRIATEGVVVEPRGSRQVSFDANPSSLPAWFAVTCRFVPVEHGPGLTLAMEITSVVIIHGGQLEPTDVFVSAKHVGTKVEVEVENSGSNLERASSGEVLGHSKQAELGTFLLFPHQKRFVETEWKEAALPETVGIQIGKKRLEAPVN